MLVKDLIKLLDNFNADSEVFLHETGSVYNFPLNGINTDSEHDIVYLNGRN